MDLNNYILLFMPFVGIVCVVAFLNWDKRRSERKRLYPGE